MKNIILKSPLFYNRNIKIDRKYVFYKTWYEKGIRFVNDLVNQNGSFYSFQEVGIDGSPLSILKYQGFIDSLKHFLSHTQIRLTKKKYKIHSYQVISKFFCNKIQGHKQCIMNWIKTMMNRQVKKDGMRNLISQTKNGRKFTTTPLI